MEHITKLYDVKAKQHVIKDAWTEWQAQHIFLLAFWCDIVFEFVFLSFFFLW